VEEIEDHLGSRPFSFRDPNSDPPMFLLCGNAGATEYSRKLVLTRPDEPYPPMALIRIKPDAVHVSNMCGPDALVQAEQFAEWLTSRYPCRIFDSQGDEYSEQAGAPASLYK
jgi:hypothetical protein